MFKKSFVVLVLSVFLATSIAAPKRSDALVGIATTVSFGVIGAPILIGGLILGGLGAAGVVSGISSNSGEGFLKALGSCAYVGLGLLILDQQGNQAVQFTALMPEQARKLEISDESLDVYNQNLAELNAVAATISSELATIEQPTVQDSAKLWNEFKADLSPEAFEVAAKISGASLFRTNPKIN